MDNKSKLLSLIRKVLDGAMPFALFTTEFDDMYWADGVHGTLEEVDNEFFYRVYECTTFVNDEEAGKWGFRSTDEYLKWLDSSIKEFENDKDAWHERVMSQEDMWA